MSNRVWTGAAAALIATVIAMGAPRAQSTTSGAIQGTVRDKASNKALPGVTVVVTSPSLQGTQAEISDDNGRFLISSLPPGVYLVTFYFSEASVRRKDVVVPLGDTVRVDQAIDIEGTGETIEIVKHAPTVNTTNTEQGANINDEYMKNIPMPGRTFASALGAAAGSQGDSRGVGFSGSTSLENQYVIDGVNTSGLYSSGIGVSLINEFIDEIHIITGGYQAEYGRATGAVISVVTKQGSNEFHGSVFGTIIPWQANRTRIPNPENAIQPTVDLDYSADFGVELGGPIIKDKVWFYVGFAPQLAQSNWNRRIQRLTDCRRVQPDGTLSECNSEMYGDGAADEDPETGFPIFQELESSNFKTNSQAYQFISKVNYALAPEHQGYLSLLGTPTSGEGTFGPYGTATATRADFTALNTDISAKWTSKFNNNKTQLDAVFGWYRDKYDQDAIDDSVIDTPTTRVYLSTLGRFGGAGGESDRVVRGCTDSNDPTVDPYPDIDNCPIYSYWLDSPGFIIDNLEDRKSGDLLLTQRFSAGGKHIAKGGVNIENNNTVDDRHYSGGRFYQLIPAAGYEQTRIYRYVSLNGENMEDLCPRENADTGAIEFLPCTYLDNSVVTGNTFNWAAFAQDSWEVQPNLIVNLGVRYEEQRMRYADHLRDTTDPFTMEPLGKNALTLQNMWAPRLGAIYDWTQEGRGKVYASFGRFYESIPMTLNDFSFSGDVLNGAYYGFGQCDADNQPSPDADNDAPSPYNCPLNATMTNPPNGAYMRGGTTLVAPGTKAQYLDEAVAGAEYELLEDLRVGVAVTTRSLGRVLDDVSIDNANTYIIGNPGTFDEGEESNLEAQIAGMPEGDPQRDLLQTRLEQFRGLRRFDKPTRNYRAIMLTASKRFSRKFFVQASYTYQRSRGNYPGLLNDDTGEALPNISTQFDLVELLPNRYGPLPQDRPHYVKLDGYYTFDLHKWGELTTGVRLRALSGTPRNVLGANATYGFDESYILPRGAEGRSDFVTGADLRLGYGRELMRGYKLEAFADFINVFNQEQQAYVYETYTIDNTNPIVGGDFHDLVFAKQNDNLGAETGDPITRYRAFGDTSARYSPLFIRFGLRLSF